MTAASSSIRIVLLRKCQATVSELRDLLKHLNRGAATRTGYVTVGI